MYRAAENFPWPNPLFQPGRWRWRAKSTFWGRKQASFGHGRAYYFLYSEEKGLSVNCCAMHQEIFDGGTAGRWLLRHYSKVPAWAGSYDNLPARQTNYLAQHERQQGEYYKQHRVNKHLLKGTKSRCGGYDVIAEPQEVTQTMKRCVTTLGPLGYSLLPDVGIIISDIHLLSTAPAGTPGLW